MRCAIYARALMVDQNCERQLRELREYCTGRNWTIVREYVDTGWGSSRPDLTSELEGNALGVSATSGWRRLG